MATTVYPTGERLMPGVPDVPLATDKATAARLVASGAFRHKAPAKAADAVELSDHARAALDLFVPPDADPTPEDQE